MPLGSNKWIPIDIRIISATNQDLSQLVAEKKFRADLYYRLNVLPIQIPPLRERQEDILPLFYTLLNRYSVVHVDYIRADLEALLMELPWHGNARELQNVAEYTANCINAGIGDWENELKKLLLSGRNADAAQKSESTTLKKIETSCDIQRVISVLEVLNRPPYKWTRVTISQQLETISPSVVKKILLTLGKEGLVISKQGEGTYITAKGKLFLRRIKSGEMLDG